MHCVNELCFIFIISIFLISEFSTPSNISTKLSLKVKSYFQSKLEEDKEILNCELTCGLKDEKRMRKLLKGVIPLLQNFEMNLMPVFVCYITQVISQ